MNIKTKNYLIASGLLLSVVVFVLFSTDNLIIYYFPAAKFYIHWIKYTILYFMAGALVWGLLWLYNWNIRRKNKNYIHTHKENSLYMANNFSGKPIYLTPSERSHHIHVIGTTGVGKTELLLNMMFQDIEQGRGFILIEHKSDHDLLDQIYEKAKREGRERDFLLFSLVHPKKSASYNPLLEGHPQSIANRLFHSFSISHEFYSKLQFEWLSKTILFLSELDEPLNFYKLYECLTSDEKMRTFVNKHGNIFGPTYLTAFMKKHLRQERSKRDEDFKGLEVHLSQFVSGRFSHLLNAPDSRISMADALYYNKIIYFQLPTMEDKETATAIGKMALQHFQSAVSSRQTQPKKHPFFSCYLDEFASLAYPNFTELISKSRSANVGLVLSHQSLGDLTKVSEDFATTVLTNTNIKIVFRCPDPKTAEYFGKSFGTKTTTTLTEQTDATIIGDERTGRGTKKSVEEFIVHPEDIKKFEIGCGAIILSTHKGVRTQKCRFPQVRRLQTCTPFQPQAFSKERPHGRKTLPNGL